MSSYNFSRVSGRDAQAFGSARPGFPSKKVAADQTSSWIDFMKSKGVKRVLSLLGDDEVEEYYPEQNIDKVMSEAYGEENYTRTSVFASNSRSVMSDALAKAKASGDSIVMHCSGGEGRAALAMGLWLVDSYGLAPSDAAREIAEEAKRTEGVVRRIDVNKLSHLVTTGSMAGFKK